MLIGVLAMTESGLIGKGDGLPWHIPDDLKHFKALTLGKTLVCGRKTWEGLPHLEGRDFIVYTRDEDYDPQQEGVKVISSSDDIVAMAFAPETYYLIGGAHMYNSFGHLCEYFYITEIQENSLEDVEGNAYFETSILDEKFVLLESTPHEDEYSGAMLNFKMYEKKEN